ncbi:hypothetical protein [Aeromicrobium sp. 179-A 4D2 NHS]|uniref:hypothetical protein n=1 Tax=Aeromicrobium sp. 179-A 4D2 NHS TaxID=3142375 RepID=UPI0039A2679E
MSIDKNGNTVNVTPGKQGFQEVKHPEPSTLSLNDAIESVADLNDGDVVWDAENDRHRTVKFIDSGPESTHIEWEDGEIELLDNDHRFPVVTDQMASAS